MNLKSPHGKPPGTRWRGAICALVCSSACMLFGTHLASASAVDSRNPATDLHGIDAHDITVAAGAVPTTLPEVPQNMNEEVIEIPAGPAGSLKLQATIFKPNGAGPFPLVVFNHGKERGNPHLQSRSRPLTFAREFVRRGYVVVAPDRRGFAGSDGVYQEDGCNVEGNGEIQALDVSATIDYMARQPYVDPDHILVAGASHGGLASLAYGQVAAAGVRGIVNFAGGLHQEECVDWKADLTQAFAAYGAHARVPTLWFYGDNDAFWPASLIRHMYGAFVRAGGTAKMIDFGVYKNNAHRLVGDRDAVTIWWPPVATFLSEVGLPTQVRYRIPETIAPPATDYAALDTVTAVPYVNDTGRLAYQAFLQQYPPRAFALSHDGAWAWAEGGDDPLSTALSHCQQHTDEPCRLYAINQSVVWPEHP